MLFIFPRRAVHDHGSHLTWCFPGPPALLPATGRYNRDQQKGNQGMTVPAACYLFGIIAHGPADIGDCSCRLDYSEKASYLE